MGEPGWSLYAAASLNDHNPWHPVMHEVTSYIQRVSFLLRQGRPANQVALLLPTDDAWANFSPGKVTITGEISRLITPTLMSTILSAGYNLDFIDAPAIDLMGLHHQILVVPPTDRIPMATLRKLQQFVASGGKVISVGRAPSLSSEGKSSPELTSLIKQLFDPSKLTFVADESSLTEALHRAAKPDLQLTSNTDDLGFIRRRLPATDIYFVANTTNHSVETKATFATTHKFAEQWNPDTTTSSPVLNSQGSLTLAPYESRIFIFTDTPWKARTTVPAASYPMQSLDLSSNWQVRFSATGRSEAQAKLTDWIANPETKFYSGEAIYTRDFTLASLPTSSTYLEVSGGTPLVHPGSEPVVDTNTTRRAGSPLPNPLVTRSGPGMRAWYDPPIREAALVFINGRQVGALWHPPYRLEVGPYLQTGWNHMEIKVYNTAINAWAALPPHDYKPLIAKYGDRFQMQDLDQVRPIPSGILGSIHLLMD